MCVCVCVLNVCLCECMSTLSDIMYRRETESCMYGGSSCMSHNTVVTSSPLLLLLSAILPLWLPFIYQCLFTSFSLLSAVHPCCPWPSLFLLVIYLSLFTCSHPRITRCTLPTSIDLTFFFFFSSTLFFNFSRWRPQHFSPLRPPRPHHHRGHAGQQRHRPLTEHVPGALPVTAAG